MIYLELLWSFIQIGFLSIGGGLAAIPLIQQQIVDIHGWLTMEQFIDLVTIAEMTPGPIAINAATFVGIQIGGIPGAIVATVGCVLPSFLIVMLLAFLYNKYKSLNAVRATLDGIRPAVVALIASAGFTILIMAFWGVGNLNFRFLDINIVAVILFTLSIIALKIFKPNPILIIVGSGIVGMAVYLLINEY